MRPAESVARFRSSALLRRLPWALLSLPVLQGFWYVHCYGVNVPWTDQWNDLALLFEKWFAGTLRFGDFWFQHNEHQCLVPRMLMFALGLLTGWNTVAEMYVTQIVLAMLLLIFVRFFLRDCPARGRLWLMLPIGFLVFSLRQSDNLLWGWQLAFVLVAAGAVASLACLALLNHPGRQTLKYLGALWFATIAMFSSAQGLMVWPVGLLPLLLAPLGKKSKTLLIAGWLVAAVIECRVYFHDYVKTSAQLKLAFSFQYFATIIGGALFQWIDVAIAAGVVLFLLSAAVLVLVYQEHQWRRHSFWLAVLLLGLLVQVQVALGRSNYGPNQAIFSRYSTCSLLIVIAIYALLSNLGGKRLRRLIRGLWALALAIVVAGLIVSTVDGYRAGADKRETREYWAFVICTCDSQPDAIFDISESLQAPMIRRITSLLKEHRWSSFSSPDLVAKYTIPNPDLPELPVQARVMFNDFGPDKDSLGLMTEGWVVDAAGKNLVGGVFLDVDGVLYPTYYGVSRNDALRTLRDKHLLCCGFIRCFPKTCFSTGRHRVTIRALSKDRTAFFQPSDPLYVDIR